MQFIDHFGSYGKGGFWVVIIKVDIRINNGCYAPLLQEGEREGKETKFSPAHTEKVLNDRAHKLLNGLVLITVEMQASVSPDFFETCLPSR